MMTLDKAKVYLYTYHDIERLDAMPGCAESRVSSKATLNQA
jgi:hypothetical protein